MLEVDGLDHAYGRHRALRGVSIRVRQKEVVAILGANGAGKTTLLNAVAGLVRPSSGSIRYRGDELIGLSAHQIVERGIATVTESRHLFGPLSVLENLSLGAFTRSARAAEVASMARVFDLFPRLAERRRQAVRTMSGGEQQMVAVGRALMARPSLLLLDEPSLGLAPVIAGELFTALGRIARESDASILIVEQNARRALKMADRAYLLALGGIVGEGKAAALAQDRAVAESYLGL
ncbi:MAG: ABC transporter ATP-binding protein [Xanthobacteraceae bacterium]|jgi:branched-chain amino acid transport system ATP-binding protein